MTEESKFHKDLRARGIDHKRAMETKKEDVQMAENAGDWGKPLKDWWAEPRVKLGDEKDDLREIRGFYLESKDEEWKEVDREGKEVTKKNKKHMILMPKTSPEEKTKVVVISGSAGINLFLSGKPRGTAVGIVFLEKKLDKGVPRNFYDFGTYPDRKPEPTWYPEFKW